MATFGKKLTENQVRNFGRKIGNASIDFGRKAGNASERIGPAVAFAGMASGNPVLASTGVGMTMGGKALSTLLKKD